MEQYTEIAGGDAKKDKKKVEKMKTSDDASVVSGDVEVGKEAGKETMAIGIDRIGMNPKEEAIFNDISEKQRLRDSLLKTYKEKFAEYVQKRDERAETQGTWLRQRLDGLAEGEALSAADQAKIKEYESNDEASNAEEKRKVDQYKRDAIDLEKEIDALRGQLNKDTN